MVRTPGSHPGDPGSIPGGGTLRRKLIAAGLEPATVGSEVQRSSIEPRGRCFEKVTGAGFEPAPPKRKELESSALDHSAILSPARSFVGRIAQSVERRSDKAKALGSSPSVTTFPAAY